MSSLYPKYLTRYKDLALLLLKHKQRDLVHRVGLDRLFESADQAEKSAEEKDAASLVADLEKLGPTFIKLGQLLSTRADLLPREYRDALVRLQDQVTPLPFATVRAVVEEELCGDLCRIFEFFEETPIASASIGQVHWARLSSGSEVAVKVQRPHIREEIQADLEVLGQLAHFLDNYTEAGHRYRFTQMLGALRRVLFKEVDYQVEAQNALRFADNLSEFDLVVIPQPYLKYTTDKVLTLEFIHGVKLTALSEARLVRLNRESLASELFQCYLHQTLIDGFFHADPHPGNLFLTDDDRLALIDFGMVVAVPQSLQHGLVKLVLALNDAEGDEVAAIAASLGRPEEGYDAAEFRERVRILVTEHSNATISKLPTGRILLDLQSIAGTTNLRLPSELMMLGKTLMNLDRLMAVLAPDFQPREEMRRYSAQVVQRRSQSMLTLDKVLKATLEAGELAHALPQRLNKITAMLAENELKFQVHAFNEKKIVAAIQKIANRVTTGLILAALLISASLVLHLESRFSMIAAVFYVLACIGGIALMIQAQLRDESEPKPHR
jgi:predicted unusual protein kinase regulating ubiquinone biosynthesis (AarF/ABC1/UbiB family)